MKIEPKPFPSGGNFKDITGLVSFRLTVVAFAGQVGKNKLSHWYCKCSCGNTVIVRGAHISSGVVKSCGCWKSEGTYGIRHGMSYTKEHRCWSHMKGRCQNPLDHKYPSYGGRGITVCERWQSFDHFLEDMGRCPAKNYSIERIDNNDIYCKSNCVWASPVRQARNQRIRVNNKTGIHGVRFDAPTETWRADIGVNGKVLILGYFNDFFSACCARKSGENLLWVPVP
jgi:hypothetical protein